MQYLGLLLAYDFYSAEQTHFLVAGSNATCMEYVFDETKTCCSDSTQSKIKMTLQTCTEYLIQQNLDVTKTVLNSTPQHVGLLLKTELFAMLHCNSWNALSDFALK